MFLSLEGVRSEYPKSSLELERLGINLSLYVILFFAEEDERLLLFPGEDVFGLERLLDSGLKKIRFS